MKRTYAKLVNKYSNKTIKQTQIEESRACDAFIAHLLGWGDIHIDLGKEWVGDSPIGSKEFNCIGMCVIPKFTTIDSYILSNYILKSLKNQHFIITMTQNVVTATLSNKKGEKSTFISAPTLSLLVARTFVELKKQK
jgi:hypothetical protein